MENKLSVGDKVKIINYGHFTWAYKDAWHKMYSSKPSNIIKETEGAYHFDISPEKVGQEDTIKLISEPQPGLIRYGLEKNGSWYSKEQLELINKENG
jgi:hypothetical protein